VALAGEVANLIVALKLDDSGFSGKLNRAAGTLKGFDGSLSRMGRGVGQVGAGLGRLATVGAAAAAGGLTAVVTTAASFEQAFTGIRKTVDETATTTFPQLEESIRAMARSIPVSFEELAGIGEAGGALGIATDDLESFIDVVARLSVSTNLTADQAATALGQLGNVLHLSGDDFRDLSDTLVALGNDGASTEAQIVDMAARFAAAGNSAGLTKEEILALSSAVASMGIEVEAGGSSLSRIFNNVATNIGTSSEKAVAFADTLGLSAREFRTAWERDALGTFQDFLTELNKLDQFAQAAVLKDIGVTNTRDIAAVRLMAQNVGFVADQLKVANTAQGALNEESQKFFDTTAGQWQTLKNNIRDAGVTIGNELLPITKELIQEFTGFLNEPGTREGLKSFAKDLAAGIRGFVTELKGTDFSGLLGGLKIAADAAKVAFDAFRSLPAPLQGAIVAAIALNKVSGGGVGLLARGLGNIALGGAGGLAGLFGKMRGQSPAAPMFVSVVGPGGLGGGLGGAAGAAGGRGFWSGVGKVFGLAAAVTIGAEIGRGIGGLVFDPTVAPAVEFETSQFNDFIKAAEGDPEELQRGLTAIEKGIYDIAGNTVDPLERWLIPQLGVLEQQRDATKALLAEAKAAASIGPISLSERPLGPPSPTQIAEFKDIGRKIDRASDSQVRALREGDIHEARMTQKQIDRLHDLRNTFDRRINDIIPHLGRVHHGVSVANRNLEEGNRRQREIASKIREQRDTMSSGFQRSNEQLGVIAAKDFSPDINLTSNTSVNVFTAAGQLIQQTRIENAISGTTPNSGFLERAG
jgi:TP901 family phage tail tape measure protein